ncbi:hypothetical protein CVT24_011380 [Panaeolus cyanescens]|uniref:IRG-type G domain-containing protein n=1 Tax=Panaeolus cyanescens TaxID=181874 RepID=A0A409VG07_9AGAR|nr:hypothetical protein CVT24_011380 [Panaeolus cyanescens]
MGNTNSRSEGEYQAARREAEVHAAEAKERAEEAQRLQEQVKAAKEAEERAEAAKQMMEEQLKRAREEDERRRAADEQERQRRDADEAERTRMMKEMMEKVEQDRVRAEKAREEFMRQAEDARRQEQESRAQADKMIKLEEELRLQAEEAKKKAEEARKEAEDRLMRGIPPELHPTVEDKLKFRGLYKLQTNKFNIAIIGESGTGKSTLINSIRGVSAGEKGAAAAGFDETTEFVEGYLDPRKPFTMWYDVPGANTPNVKGWTYFIDQGLYVFDILVVVFSGRFTETVGTLLSNAIKCGIPTFLVRAKADSLMQSAKRDSQPPPSDAAAKEIVVSRTQSVVAKNLEKLELPDQRVYILSMAAMKEWVVNGRQSFEMIHEAEFLDDIIKLLESTVPGVVTSCVEEEMVYV